MRLFLLPAQGIAVMPIPKGKLLPLSLLPRLKVGVATITLGCLVPSVASAQRVRPITEGFANTISPSVSVGVILSRDAWFRGVALAYARSLGKGWVIDLSLAYDAETEHKPAGNTTNSTITGTVAVGKMLTERLAVGTGFGHGLVSDAGPNKSLQGVRFGDDLNTAIVGAYTLGLWGPHDVTVSVALEYNISDNDASTSLDLAYGFSF